MTICLLLPQHNFTIFRRNVLLLNFILTFCLIHGSAIEHTLQESLVRTGEIGGEIVSIERTIC